MIAFVGLRFYLETALEPLSLGMALLPRSYQRDFSCELVGPSSSVSGCLFRGLEYWPKVEKNAQFESLDGFAISSAEVIQLSVDQ